MKCVEPQQLSLGNSSNNIDFCWMADFLLGKDDWIPATSGGHWLGGAYRPEHGLPFIRAKCGPRLLGLWFVFWPFSILGEIVECEFFPVVEYCQFRMKCPISGCVSCFFLENLVFFFLVAAWACSCD